MTIVCVVFALLSRGGRSRRRHERSAFARETGKGRHNCRWCLSGFLFRFTARLARYLWFGDEEMILLLRSSGVTLLVLHGGARSLLLRRRWRR